jgi:hypothetical protein
LIERAESKTNMEISINPDEEQKNNPANPAAVNIASKNQNPAASTGPDSAERTRAGHQDLRATQKLARKKRLKAAHRRRLKASHTKG